MTKIISHFESRCNEDAKTEFDRTGRFFSRKGSWFFKTREAVDYGPYHSRVECRYAYNEFIDIVANSKDLPTESFDYQDDSSDWKLPKINFS